MSSTTSSKQKELYALKQQAINYYEENKVPIEMENVLNAMFYDKPPDVYGYLANYFGQFCKPATLSQLTAKPVLDSNGLITIQIDVYGTVNNVRKYISSSVISRANIKVNLEDKAEEQISISVKAAIIVINSEISHILDGIDPSAQQDIDSEILAAVSHLKKQSIFSEKADRKMTSIQMEKKMTLTHVSEDDKLKKMPPKNKNGKTSAVLPTVPDKPPEILLEGCEAAAAVSQAVCVCAATSRGIPVYQHVVHLAQQHGTNSCCHIPIPMVTIMECGKHFSGKVVCVKEFMIFPGINMPVDKGVEHIHNINSYVSKYMVAKYGPFAKLVNDTGALCPNLDTVNQGLDILLEAIKAEGLTIGEDMYLALNCAGYDFYDHEKGKYETLSGQFKSPEEMVDFWVDIILKYPCIVAIIDPIRGEDIEQWLRLCEKISNQVLVIGDTFFQRPGIIRRMEFPVQTSGIVMHVERMNTITDIIACAKKFQDCNNELVISANHVETNDTFIVDLAVGLSARFLKIGGLCRGERICKLNRLIQIFTEIASSVQAIEAANNKETSIGTVDDSESAQVDISSLLAETSGSKKVNEGSIRSHKNLIKAHLPFTFPLIKSTNDETEVDEPPV